MHDKPRRVLLLIGEAQLAGCLKVKVGSLLELDAKLNNSDYAKSVTPDTAMRQV